MRKSLLFLFVIPLVLLFGGCGVTGEKTASLSLVYAVAAVCAFVVFVAYFLLISKKDKWSILLFISVFVVNVGYFFLSTADTLEIALWANRIAYFGSVFLPLSMFMIIIRVTNIKIYKWVPSVLFVLSAVVFLIAASPGYLDIYYEWVKLDTINGVTVLDKGYGPLHVAYLFYLLGYFAAMIAAITYATVKKRVESNYHAIIFATAVFVNIGVWFFGQVIPMNFEFLSISYIITELFILGLYLLLQENELRSQSLVFEQTNSHESKENDGKLYSDEVVETFKNGVSLLTATERKVYDIYTEGKSTRDAMNALGITENTLKYHNRNIYGKLGVANKKQMIEILAYIEKSSSEN